MAVPATGRRKLSRKVSRAVFQPLMKGEERLASESVRIV
jgi:hypothetical protein